MLKMGIEKKRTFFPPRVRRFFNLRLIWSSIISLFKFLNPILNENWKLTKNPHRVEQFNPLTQEMEQPHFDCAASRTEDVLHVAQFIVRKDLIQAERKSRSYPMSSSSCSLNVFALWQIGAIGNLWLFRCVRRTTTSQGKSS